MPSIQQTLGIIVLALLIGCNIDNKNSPAVQAVSDDESNQLNAQHSRFEHSEDPPFTADTHYAAGCLAETQGNFEQASRQYQAALKIDPQHLRALYRMGIVYSRLQKFPQAIDTWKTYIKITGDAAASYNNLGYCYESAGRLTDAEAAYQKGIQIDPASIPCHTNYGLMLARSGRTDEAITQFQTVLTPAQTHYNLASVHEQQGHKQQAKNEYQKALDLDPNFTAARTKLVTLK